MEQLEDPMITLLRDYAELNPPHIDIFDNELPSALEFMRYVSLNRPFVVRSGAYDWEATRSWDVGMLKTILKDQYINVAVTPFGNADSPVRSSDNDDELLFVKPCMMQQDFTEFVDFIVEQEKRKDIIDDACELKEVRYSQAQNDNLRDEYISLFPHVAKDIPWARIALQKTPDAINLWLGNSLSVTALHKDNYENIYVQIIGQKHFVLLPPVAYACVSEQILTPASYLKTPDDKWKIQKEENAPKIPFPTWDEDKEVDKHSLHNKYSDLIVPIRVTLAKGDMLYLPALWYHKVSQSCSEEGICCAVNYWYDMQFNGSLYSLCNYVQNTMNLNESVQDTKDF
ncbi:JmjC domain-containing protein 7 [Erysiphe neolycopersici]|uniref:JmjC domain-containing protein 7 n=1 Tax=Erysiphe neolycopersici TaxID=212602 RepID=A0A420I4K7_9PEZI|nr:JmjC domain-containing protein 7 [Erysiphe neolycopersici]